MVHFETKFLAETDSLPLVPVACVADIIPRSRPDAFVEDPREAVRQAIWLIREKGIQTLCVHGDNPQALAFVRALCDGLTAERRCATGAADGTMGGLLVDARVSGHATAARPDATFQFGATSPIVCNSGEGRRYWYL